MEDNPGARLIITVRDGRDVVASQLRNYEHPSEYGHQDWRRATVREAQSLWLKYMLAWERWRPQLPARRFIELRYEDAVADVDTLLRRLLELTGAELDLAGFDAFREFYRPTHVGTWRKTHPDLDQHLSEDFLACLGRWGY